MASRSRHRSSFLLSLLASVGALSACLLADPPADIPVAPLVPPEIVRVDVQPPITSFLDSTDVFFIVPVSIDPRQDSLEWEWFIDNVGLPAKHVDTIDGGTLVVLSVGVVPATALPPGECHTLELVVDYPGVTSVPSDSVSWFYSETRTFAGCSVFDAGGEDAGTDGNGGGD
jgi:hypothetical protein